MKKINKVNKVDKVIEKKWKEDKKFLLSIEDVMSLKIIKETLVNYVKFDIEMSSALQQYLIQYAEQKMKKEDKENLLSEWAFIKILTKRINQIQTRYGKIEEVSSALHRVSVKRK